MSGPDPSEPTPTRRDPTHPSAYLSQAIDINVGVVARWTFVGNTTKAVFYLFLALFLFPAIAGQSRVIIMDNLTAHFDPIISELFAIHGHSYVRRSVHSPDFGPRRVALQLDRDVPPGP